MEDPRGGFQTTNLPPQDGPGFSAKILNARTMSFFSLDLFWRWLSETCFRLDSIIHPPPETWMKNNKRCLLVARYIHTNEIARRTTPHPRHVLIGECMYMYTPSQVILTPSPSPPHCLSTHYARVSCVVCVVCVVSPWFLLLLLGKGLVWPAHGDFQRG